jgi:hypothetical protein
MSIQPQATSAHATPPSRTGQPAGPPKRPGPPKDANPSTGQTGDSSAAEEEGGEEEGEPRSYRSLFLIMPSWLVSLVVHMVILIVAAFLTFALPSDAIRDALIVHAVEPTEEIEELTEFEMDLENVDVLDHSPTPTSVIDPGMQEFGDPTEDLEVSEDGVVDVADISVSEIGALFGRDGQGMASIGDGMGGAAYFGTVASGRRFVYVIDNSNSMTRGRFETAINELVRSVDSMSQTSSFYVIFFSDTAYPLFHPSPAPGFVKATEENKTRLKQWLRTAQLCLYTDGRKAMEIAFSMRPDTIYILGDGAFTDDTTKRLTAPHQRSIPIHTFGMEVDQKGEWQLKDIAKANNGKYTPVRAHPLAQQMAQKNPIPRNRTRGPVWGVTLPLVAKKAGGGPRPGGQKKGPGGQKKGPRKKKNN